MFKGPRALENGLQMNLVRAVDRLSLDASGNISFQKRVRNVESENKYVRLADLFTEVKVLSLKCTFVPSTAIRNTTLAMGTLMTAVVHDDYTNLQSIGDLIAQVPNVKLHCMANPKIITKVWHHTPQDSDENTFYNCGGTSIGPVIPTSLGGIIFWCDGPIAAAGTYVGDVISEYSLLYRGMRND
jgi:hypothetical protein